MKNHSERTAHQRVIFGAGSLELLGDLAQEAGAHRVLLVTDAGLVRAGHAQRAVNAIELAGVSVHVFDRVSENPTTRDVDACVADAQAQAVDFIVGMGGGSSMDTAKGANFILTNGGHMADYRGHNKARRPMLPMIAIPTTAGTGSECQSYALIADAVTHQKMACGDDKAFPRIALLDPELTLSLPRRVTANTGIDALTHALESHVTSVRTAESQSYSRKAWRLIEQNLETVLLDPSNVAARGAMLRASAYGGMAIAHSMLGAVHAAANPLSARFDLVHGQAVGILLPHVMSFNARDPQALAQYRDLAASANLARPDDDPEHALQALLARIIHLLNSAEIPDGLDACGVDRASFPALAQEAARQWTATYNPVKLDTHDFVALYRAAHESRAAAQRAAASSHSMW